MSYAYTWPPNCGSTVGNVNVKYGPVDKIWPCRLCNYQGSNYEWVQVLSRANTKRNNLRHIIESSRKQKGMRVELENDITASMEIEYGRIKTRRQYDIRNNRLRYIIWLHCAYANTTKVD